MQWMVSLHTVFYRYFFRNSFLFFLMIFFVGTSNYLCAGNGASCGQRSSDEVPSTPPSRIQDVRRHGGPYYQQPEWSAWVAANPDWLRWILYNNGPAWCLKRVGEHHPSCQRVSCKNQCWERERELLHLEQEPPPHPRQMVADFQRTLRELRGT